MRFFKKHFKWWPTLLLLGFCALVLGLSLRGAPGNPTAPELNRDIWKDNGPLELSPERGRYALTYAIAETKTFVLSTDLARFAAPDVGYTNGHYVSLFAPTVSFIVIPGYFIGKFLGIAQVGSFAVISLFAIFNLLFIRAIAMRLGAHPIAATVGGIAFLFASPAFPYAVTLYQHHISTFLILSSLYLLLRFNTIWSLIIIWMLCALSISVDYPNLFMMLPIGFFALGRVFIAERHAGKINIKIPFLRVLTIGSMILPLAFFLWFNAASYGNPFQLSGTIERSVEVKPNGTPLLETEAVIAQMKAAGQQIPTEPQGKSALAFFQTRQLLNGFYEHFISLDRGMITFTPVMLFGILGLLIAIKKRQKYVALFSAVIGFNVLLYSMWTDPYGGWAFGSRYLIPTYAILSVYVALLLSRFSKSTLVVLFFFVFLAYSVGVNTLGALTSNRNPPKVEAVALSEVTHQPEPYTYQRNIDMLNANLSKSYVYESFAANSITAWNYYFFVTGFILIVTVFLLATLKETNKGGRNEF